MRYWEDDEGEGHYESINPWEDLAYTLGAIILALKTEIKCLHAENASLKEQISNNSNQNNEEKEKSK